MDRVQLPAASSSRPWWYPAATKACSPACLHTWTSSRRCCRSSTGHRSCPTPDSTHSTGRARQSCPLLLLLL